MRRFELVDGTASKFWEIEVDGKGYAVRFGRIGTTGRAQSKSLGTNAQALAAADKLIRQKLAKGYVEVAASGSSKPKQGTRSKAKKATEGIRGPMTETLFWKLIARLDWKQAGDDDRVVRPVVAALAELSVDDIFAFEDLLAEKLYALDTRAVAREIYRGEVDPDDGDDYISADDFLYSRCVVVANGKRLFDAVMKNPRKAPQGLEFESLLYLASTAYEGKTGEESPHETPLSWESFSNAAGWKRTKRTKPGKFTSKKIPPGNRRP